MVNRYSGFCLIISCLLLFAYPAKAQVTGNAILSAPEMDSFPHIQVYLDVRDGQGNFYHGLKEENVQILEDGRTLPAHKIDEIRRGIQLVVAINPGPTFAVRNSQGISRYDSVVQALDQWAESRLGTTVDDLSFLLTGGAQTSHTPEFQQWISQIKSNEADARDSKPDLNTLIRAVDVAADPSPRAGMGRVVLFVSPPLEGQAVPGLQDLSVRAKQENVHIFVWLVSPPGAPMSEASEQLLNLAQETGGQLAHVSGEEPIPGLESYLEPLRDIYHLTYDSKITSSGTHQLAVDLQMESNHLKTAVRSFDLDIQSPDPAFVSPVLEILRKPPAKSGFGITIDEIPVQEFVPKSKKLQVVIDFPDGRTRPLTETSLYVDGALVDQNTEPPFDQFTWDLRPYSTSGNHKLQVEAKDSLGLSGSSIETVVQVTVERPAPSVWRSLYRHMPVLVGLVALLAGSIFLLILVLGGRIRPYRHALLTLSEPKPAATSQTMEKKQPVQHRLPGWINRLQWPQRHLAPQAYAFLTRVSEADNLPVTTPVPVLGEEMTLGNDPGQSTLVLDDPSVEGLHARLIREEAGVFRLSDEGSTSGTWVNYTPVPKEGVKLEQGDLIHIGRVSFRFTLRQPGQMLKPVVTLDKSRREGPYL